VGTGRSRVGTAALLVATGLVGCASNQRISPTPTAQIRGNFKRLVVALRDRDAVTACELMFPFGEHNPHSILAAELRQFNTASGRAGYQVYVKRCAPSFAADPRNFSGYYRIFGTVALGSVSVHGNEASAAATTPGQKPFTLRFVKMAREWRLLERVQ
jgi:hypothetical protein